MCQLRVYLGVPWEDVTASVNWDTNEFDDVIPLHGRIQLHFDFVKCLSIVEAAKVKDSIDILYFPDFIVGESSPSEPSGIHSGI